MTLDEFSVAMPAMRRTNKSERFIFGDNDASKFSSKFVGYLWSALCECLAATVDTIVTVTRATSRNYLLRTITVTWWCPVLAESVTLRLSSSQYGRGCYGNAGTLSADEHCKC